jgi:hypothetical protein
MHIAKRGWESQHLLEDTLSHHQPAQHQSVAHLHSRSCDSASSLAFTKAHNKAITMQLLVSTQSRLDRLASRKAVDVRRVGCPCCSYYTSVAVQRAAGGVARQLSRFGSRGRWRRGRGRVPTGCTEGTTDHERPGKPCMSELHKQISWHHGRPGPLVSSASCCYLSPNLGRIDMCPAATRPASLDHMLSLSSDLQLQLCLPCSGGNCCWCVD